MEYDKTELHHLTIQNSIQFIEAIINGMYDWVRVLDRDDNIIYMNKSMAEGLKGAHIGSKCYYAVGRDTPCENCISRKAVFEGVPHEKEEIIDGRIFSVMSSPIRDENGDIIAVVEVLRDVTQVRQLQQKILKQNKKLQDDLTIAKKLQCSLLPKELPKDKFDFSFIYRPCETLGGDFIDIFRIDADHTGVYIADVSGHGVSASMLTVFLRTSINKKILSPSQALNELYRQFNQEHFDQDLYITVFYAVINTKDYTMTYSNAGHNVCPILFSKDRFELLRTPGTPISDWVDESNYIEKTVALEKGDRVFLYTDGIVEIKNDKKEQFGEERLLAVLLTHPGEPGSTLTAILESVNEFANIKNMSESPDDITIALLEMK